MRKSKILQRAMAVGMAALALAGATSAFADTYDQVSLTDSIGSVAADISKDDMTESAYTRAGDSTDVTGNDVTQSKESEYTIISQGDAGVDFVAGEVSAVDVYVTVAEGGDYPNGNDGTIRVEVPTVIILDGATAAKQGVATVTAKGNIAGTTLINVVPVAAGTTITPSSGEISVTPITSLTLSQSGKADITATLSQPVQHFAAADSSFTASSSLVNTLAQGTAGTTAQEKIDNVVKGTGTVTIGAPAATAGSWHGSYAYAIFLSTGNAS